MSDWTESDADKTDLKREDDLSAGNIPEYKKSSMSKEDLNLERLRKNATDPRRTWFRVEGKELKQDTPKAREDGPRRMQLRGRSKKLV